MRQSLALLLISLLMAATRPVSAQDGPGNVQEGLALARRDCAQCHVVEGPPRSETDPIPAFLSIAGQAATTETGLRVFLQTMHPSMPDLMLSRQERDDIITYILSLRGAKQGR
jgi:mono/diheme cytochrome c family protein